MKWSIDSFQPSSGETCGTPDDHLAWLKGESEEQPTLHMKVQFGSDRVSEDRAKAILDAVLAGLNAPGKHREPST